MALYIAYRVGFFPMLLTLASPVLSQPYWIYEIWSVTSVFVHLLTQLCILSILVMVGGATAAALA